MRIVLEMDEGGRLSLHHDAGQPVIVELYRREHGRLIAATTKDRKAVASNTMTAVARVVPGATTYRLEAES